MPPSLLVFLFLVLGLFLRVFVWVWPWRGLNVVVAARTASPPMSFLDNVRYLFGGTPKDAESVESVLDLPWMQASAAPAPAEERKLDAKPTAFDFWCRNCGFFAGAFMLACGIITAVYDLSNGIAALYVFFCRGLFGE